MIIPAAVILLVVGQILPQPAMQCLQHGCVTTGMPPPESSLHWEDTAFSPSE